MKLIKSEYLLGSEHFQDWEAKHPNTQWIVISGNVSYDQYRQFDMDFDYTKYQRITIEDVNVQKYVYENGYEATFEDVCESHVYNYDCKLSVLTKLVLGKDKDYVVSEQSVYSFDGKTLYHMEEAKEITIHKNVEHIGDFAFANYDTLSAIQFVDGLKSIGKWAFRGTGLGVIELPDSLASLGEGAFCTSDAEKVKFPRFLEVIPSECFCLCMIAKISIPNSVKIIESCALRGNFFSHIDIPEGVEKIEYNAFDQLDSISLPSTLKEIADDFYYEDCIDDPQNVPYITVHPDNPIFFSKDGTLYYRESGNVATKCKYTKKVLPCNLSSS